VDCFNAKTFFADEAKLVFDQHVAGGPVVDEAALVQALESKKNCGRGAGRLRKGNRLLRQD